jgi:hypothetical protein
MTLRVARIYFGLAWWATGRDRAWGLLLWALTVLLVVVSFLVAGVPHSGSKLTARLRRRATRADASLAWAGSTGSTGPGGPARAADRGLPGLGGGTAGPVVG